MTNPTFFILGAPKCGTTTLAQWLGQHPNIFMSEKESHYFACDLGNRLVRTQSEYQRLFSEVRDEQLMIGEPSVWYMYSHVAVENIVSFAPGAKLIVCLRNPIEMAWSLHNQHLLNEEEDILDFEDAWDAQDDRRKGARIPELCTDRRLLMYGPACSIGTQLQRLYDMGLREQVCTVLLDDMKYDPGQVYREVLKFLNIHDDRREEFPVVNMAAKRRWPKFNKMIVRASVVRRRLGLPSLGVGRVLSKVNRTPKRSSTIPPMVRMKLMSYFKDDIAQLERLLNRDLQHWQR